MIDSYTYCPLKFRKSKPGLSNLCKSHAHLLRSVQTCKFIVLPYDHPRLVNDSSIHCPIGQPTNPHKFVQNWKFNVLCKCTQIHLMTSSWGCGWQLQLRWMPGEVGSGRLHASPYANQQHDVLSPLWLSDGLGSSLPPQIILTHTNDIKFMQINRNLQRC